MMSWVMAAALVVMLWSGAAAQSGCTVALMSLSPCLNYVSGNSSTPSSSCCSSLSSVVGSQPQCLCTLLKGGASNLGITVNQTLAVALPGACSVQTPPLSRCDGAVSGPSSAPAPADSPSGSSTGDDTPDDPSTPDSSVPHIPSGAGSKTVPGTDGTTTNSAGTGRSNLGANINVVGTLVVLIMALS